MSEDTILDRLHKAPPASLPILGGKLFLYPLLILPHNLKFLFGGVLGPLVLVLKQVLEVDGPFLKLGPDRLLGQFLQLPVNLLHRVLFYLLLLGEVLFLNVQHLLPGLLGSRTECGLGLGVLVADSLA